MGYDVVISYATEDREHARALFRALKERSVETFVDFETLVSGDLWEFRIATEIEKARITAILVPDHDSSRGYYNLAERTKAINVHRASGTLERIVPICLAGRTPGFALEPLHSIFFEKEGSWEAVAAKVQARLAHEEKGEGQEGGHPVPPLEPAPTLPELALQQVSGVVGEGRAKATKPERPWRYRELQATLLREADARLDRGAGSLLLPILVCVDSPENFGQLRDPRQFLRSETAPGRIVLIGRTGSGRREIVQQLLSFVAGAARAYDGGIGSIRSPAARLLPVVVHLGLDGLQDPLELQLPVGVREGLQADDAFEFLWPIVLDPQPVNDQGTFDVRIERLRRSPWLWKCKNQLLVVHDSAAPFVTGHWTRVRTAGVFVERLDDEVLRRRLKLWTAWAGVEPMPPRVARLAAATPPTPRADRVNELVRHFLQEDIANEVSVATAAAFSARTLPQLLRRAHESGRNTIGVGVVNDLAREPGFFPPTWQGKDVVACMSALSFPFRLRGTVLQSIRSALTAELTADGYALAGSVPRLLPSSTPFDVSVAAAWNRIRSNERVGGVPALVECAHAAAAGERVEDDLLRNAVASLDRPMAEHLMQSELADLIAATLSSVAESTEVQALMSLADPISRALWSHELLCGRHQLDPATVTSLLGLIEPAFMESLLTFAPTRRARLIESAGVSPNTQLLQLHFSPLIARRRALFPPDFADRMEQPLPESR